MQMKHVQQRFDSVASAKASGATYTPPELGDFVAAEMLHAWKAPSTGVVRVLDPAAGNGELLLSLLRALPKHLEVEVYGFDCNQEAIKEAQEKLTGRHPKASLHLEHGDFLSFVAETGACGGSLFSKKPEPFDLIIANPPYVRTQILGAQSAQDLAAEFGLAGRVDLYHAFVLAIAALLEPKSVAGIIISNRFMTTKAGASVRRVFGEKFSLRHVWDLGDTKFFDAAVLPAVIIGAGLDKDSRGTPGFTTIYSTADPGDRKAESVIDALNSPGVVELPDGRRFRVRHGTLDSQGEPTKVWAIANEETDTWLASVQSRTWSVFGSLGKIRVGVKTCADSVFIRSNWSDMPVDERPELLRPLTTHHVARRYRADSSMEFRQILYTHASDGEKRTVVDLARYPRSRSYLESHRAKLESRRYVLEAGRQWFEIWVPQDPAAWQRTKLVFRDISERPCFWIDQSGSVVNGDCYWLVCEDPNQEDLLWLALGVANSTFAEAFYDRRFNNKLYAGRRRFITQYVEQFPLPDPALQLSRQIVGMAKLAYEAADPEIFERIQAEVDKLTWASFGLSPSDP